MPREKGVSRGPKYYFYFEFSVFLLFLDSLKVLYVSY